MRLAFALPTLAYAGRMSSRLRFGNIALIQRKLLRRHVSKAIASIGSPVILNQSDLRIRRPHARLGHNLPDRSWNLARFLVANSSDLSTTFTQNIVQVLWPDTTLVSVGRITVS